MVDCIRDNACSNFQTGQEFGADDFLPALSYVMVLCNMPEVFLEVEYMMELLETCWLTGEGTIFIPLFGVLECYGFTKLSLLKAATI